MKRFLPVLLFLSAALAASSQQQVYDLMERTDLKLQEVEARANRYFDSAGRGRGTGYKQFQRWLWERKFHVDENGYFIPLQTEWNNFIAARNMMRPDAVVAANWTPIGPSGWTQTSGWNPGTGRLTALAIHPANQNIIYVGSPGGGLWKSTNAGSTWAPLTDNNSLRMFIFGLAIDPLDQNTLYAATDNSSGVLKSTDAGVSWSPTGAGPVNNSGRQMKILIHPTSTNIVFAAASNGIWRSTNGGTNWTQVHAQAKEDIEFKPGDLNIMYSAGNNVARSTDLGLTWTVLTAAEGITNSGRTLLAVSAADPEVVYAVQASGSSFGRLYRSSNSGASFVTTVTGSPGGGTNYFGYEASGTGTGGQATYDMGMDVSPTNANDVYIAGIICWRSTNGGTSFTPLTEWFYPNGTGYNHADVHGVFWIGNILYSISDGGLYKSLNNGGDWTDLSTGLTIRQFYRMANSQVDPNVITGGAQDNGSVTRQTSGNWADWLGADGMEGLVSPTNPLRIWGTSQGGAIYRSTNGGASYTNLTQPSSGQWVTPLFMHPTNETILYGGWTGVWKSITSGTSWTNISAGVITQTLADLAVSSSDPNYIYASNGSTLWVTTNDGATWTTRSAPATINDIAIDPTDPNKIWIACNSATNRILVSTNAGATFTNISANLPAIAARAVTVDDKTPRGIYVGMNIGVYYKQEPDANWTDYTANLPLVAINELEIQKNSEKIRVATYGRSIWESPLADVLPPSGFTFNSPAPATAACPAPSTMSITLGTIASGGFTNPITLSATAGVPAGTTISFSPNPVTPGNSSVVTLNNANTLAAGSYVITITGTATGATNQTRDLTFTITAGSGPAITAQPSNQVICEGTNTSFFITSTAASSFQWQVSTDGGATWNNISNGPVYSGATTATLNITGATISLNNNRYRCVATALCGSTNSNVALLNVNDIPVIVTNPSGTTVCSGASFTLCVTATGTNLVYQWQSGPTCAGPFTDIVGATTNCLTTAVISPRVFRCRVSNGCASNITSACVAVDVVTAVAITSQPSDVTVCAGANASFTVAGSGTGNIYQWQLSTDGGITYNNISGATAATYTTTGVTVGMSGNRYRAQVSNATCTTPGVSNGAILTVNTAPVISAQPANSTICAGSNTSFTIVASGTGLTYQWQASPNGCVGPWTDVVGGTSPTLNLTSVPASMNNTVFRCVVTGVCTPPAISNCVTLTVVSPATITSHPVNTEICSGSTVTFNVAGPGTGIVYEWQVSTDGGATWTTVPGATTATLTLNNVPTSANNNRYRARLSNATCTTPAVSNAATLTVRQLPTIGLSAAPFTTLLPGQTTTLTATPSASTGGVLTTAWFRNNNVFSNTGNTYVADVENIGTYHVTISETFGSGLVCASQSGPVVITAGVSNRLFIFPSPNDGSFTVSYYNNGGANTSRTITVFDAKGAKVYNAKFPVSGPYTLIPVNIKPAQTGIYIVVVGDASGKKLVEGKVLVKQ